MSQVPASTPPPPGAAGQPARRQGGAFGGALLTSVLFNFLFLILVAAGILAAVWFGAFGDVTQSLTERFHSGKTSARDKIAVVRVDGVIMENTIGFARKQIEQATKDDHVKAVVLRINSPGGSVTASDDLYRRLNELREGDPAKKTQGRPLVVSMGGLTASGGYYIAMSAPTLVAEPTTTTGSIGVYTALPNITDLSQKIGLSMEVIKAGEVKDSGSPFRSMTPKERDLWQDMVDHAYLRFLQVVENGRPHLKGKLQDDLVIDETVPVRTAKEREQHRKYTRYRADGGIFTAEQAKQYGLVDQIGYLDDAVQAAKSAAGLGDDYKVITYQRPRSLLDVLGGQGADSATTLDPGRLAEAATPRLWYLAPQSELAGVLTAACHSRPGREP